MLNLAKIKEMAGIFGKGMLLHMAPSLTGGVINDYFHEWKVDEVGIAAAVKNNRCLWEKLTDDQWEHLSQAAETIGGLDFLTPELVIDSIKKDFPGVASQFVNWPAAGEWLGHQLDLMRQELSTR